MTEPTGITLEDQQTGELVHHDRLHLTVWYNGEPRTLRLRMARGILEAEAPSLRDSCDLRIFHATGRTGTEALTPTHDP